MLRLRIAVPVLLVLAWAPADALGAARDIAATHAYIRANYAFVSASEAKMSTALQNITRYIHKIGLECPNVGAGSPQDEESQHMSLEAAGALWSISYGTDQSLSRRLLREVRGLKWSNSKLTRIAQRYARGMFELSTLPTPDICGDVRTWSSSGFKTIPARTISFDQHVESIEGPALPGRLLAPYVQAQDRTLLRGMQRLETKLEHTETMIGFNDWNSLLETLGLNQ
jgi:hypothetical protein